jgi:hypothetical protein
VPRNSLPKPARKPSQLIWVEQVKAVALLWIFLNHTVEARVSSCHSSIQATRTASYSITADASPALKVSIPGKSWPRLLEKRLAESLPDRKVEVLNSGIALP